MGQRLLSLRVRPARVAILLNSTSSPAEFLLAVRFLSQVWGGRFNPILPVSADRTDPLTEYRLQNNRPDFVFGLNLDDSVWKPFVHKACQSRQYVRLDRRIAENAREADHLDLIHADRAIIANVERRTKPSAITRRVKMVSVDPSSELLPYYAAVFGLHPNNLKETYRDEQQGREIPSAVDLVNDHKDFVEGWKQSWLDVGSFGLASHHVLSPPLAPTIVVVKDLIADLSLFWNLRLASDTSVPAWIIPVPEPTALSDELQSALAAWLLAFIQEDGNEPNYCVMTSVSVARESIEPIRRRLQATLRESSIQYVDYVPPRNRLPQVLAYDHATTWPVELRGARLTIVPPSPQTFSLAGSSESWFVDLLKDNKTGRAIRDMQLPESVVIPELLNAPCPPSIDHSIVPRFGDGVDAVSIRCTSNREVIHFQVPTSAEVLEEILRDRGYDMLPDEKRSSYLPTIKRFGGLQLAATAMSGQAGTVLEILRSGRLRSSVERSRLDDVQHQSILLAQGHALTPKQIKSIGKLGNGKLGDAHFLDRIEKLLAKESDRLKRVGMKRFRRYAHRQVPDEMTLQALLEHWADKSVLRRKWELGPCPRCGRSSLMDRIELRNPQRCLHCGNHLRMKEFTNVGYSLEPSVRHSLNEGLGTVVLTGRFLRNMTDKGFFWLPGVKFNRADRKGDIDLLACCDGQLVFGECKKLTSTPDDATSWDTVTGQFLKLASIAIECGGAIVVLAALVDVYPDTVQQRIETELSGKIPFLLLNKADLEKGRRPAQTDKEWPSLILEDLLPERFPEVRIEREPGPRQIKLGWAVYKSESVDPANDDASASPK
ncbi:MAG: hypothetical protein AB7O68_00625 [Pirellulales bacterium]